MAVGNGKNNQQVEILPLVLNSAAVYDLSKGNSLVLLTTGYKHIFNIYVFISVYRVGPLLEPGFASHFGCSLTSGYPSIHGILAPPLCPALPRAVGEPRLVPYTRDTLPHSRLASPACEWAGFTGAGHPGSGVK